AKQSVSPRSAAVSAGPAAARPNSPFTATRAPASAAAGASPIAALQYSTTFGGGQRTAPPRNAECRMQNVECRAGSDAPYRSHASFTLTLASPTVSLGQWVISRNRD